MHEIQLILSPKNADDELSLRTSAALQLDIDHKQIIKVVPLKRSIDARQKDIKIHLTVAVYLDQEPDLEIKKRNYPDISGKPKIIIVGCGPAGMFAALRAIELNCKPIILERGKDVKSRRRDLAAINKQNIVNPESNYCFGEGGAGTYSDGKLYTRSKKRGNVERVLDILIEHGANKEIKVDTHPHIGTNKLPKIIEAMRETILNAGGEIHFNTCVSDFIIENKQIKGVVANDKNEFIGNAVILATGHSARDIYYLLRDKSILIEQKSFAMGVRIEHPQKLIDSIQYKCEERDPYLPAAPYSLVDQVKNRGVYSFCMCPGGFIVPSATGPEQVVVNGMSPSKRDSQFANSGIVVGIELEDLNAYASFGPLAGLEYQKEIEKIAYIAGGQTQSAPTQRVVDFCENKVSSTLLDTSYQPGTTSAALHEVLPKSIVFRLQKALKTFGYKLNGYFTNEAQILGVESRTSAPVRIPRDRDTMQHVEIKGLYPCGEGAGYAGGIVSAAIDGERCAEKIVAKLKL